MDNRRVKRLEEVLESSTGSGPWVCLHGEDWTPDVEYKVTIEGAAPDAVMRWKEGDPNTTDSRIGTTWGGVLRKGQEVGFQLPSSNLGVARVTVKKLVTTLEPLIYDRHGSAEDPDADSPSATVQISKAEDDIEKDADVLRAIRRAWPGCDPVQALDYATELLNAGAQTSAGSSFRAPKDAQRVTLYLPTAGSTQSPPQLLWVDATQGNVVEHSLAPLSGQTMRIWGFNLKPSQSLAVVQGPRADSAELGILIAYGLSAGVGASVGVTPSVSAPSAAPNAPASSGGSGTDGCDAKCSPAPCTVTCQSSKEPVSGIQPPAAAGSECAAAPAKLAQYVAALVNAKLAAPKKQRFQTAVAFPSVTGNYNYIAEILDPTFGQAPPSKGVNAAMASDSGPPVPSKGTPVAITTPIVASESFRSHNLHRALSVGIEEAWSAGTRYPTGGFSYMPVTQSGPDQIYQLQGVPSVANQLTFSALLLWYPGPTFGQLNHHPFWDGVVVGFGPSLLRGGSAELFRQWNLRLGYEFNDVAVTLGASARNLDIPGSAAPNSLVAVPKPATTPSFATTDGWEPLFSVGLTVDLDILAAGINVVSAAAKGAK